MKLRTNSHHGPSPIFVKISLFKNGRNSSDVGGDFDVVGLANGELA
jgi:hypothetical protein